MSDPTPAQSGRLKRYDQRTSTAIRFPPELHERLHAAAAERDVSLNWMVNRAVEEFLENLIPMWRR